MSYQPIEDYGIIGDMNTVALVGKNGSIDWFCFPHLDSPSVFAGLLDQKNGGKFLIQPYCDFDSSSEYLPQTNILITRFRTRSGEMKLTDFMALGYDLTGNQVFSHRSIYRLIEIEKGVMEVLIHFEPSFNYARNHTNLCQEKNCLLANDGDRNLILGSTKELHLNDNRKSAQALWQLKKEERVVLKIDFSEVDEKIQYPDLSIPDIKSSEERLRNTKQFWQDWLNRNETGNKITFDRYQGMIERSALILKLLYHDPSGTIAAAATTSIPEEIGGERNWDYRFTWIRDTAFTLDALFHLGHLSEMEGYFHWFYNLLENISIEELKIMYGLSKESVSDEMELVHLDGYKGAKPVRIGNNAAGQRQIDIYGEILDAALKLSQYVGKIKVEQWPALRRICDYVVEHWQEKDFGIWEVRKEPRHFIHSKVMCWVALDRGIIIARRYGFEADLATWEKTKRKIHKEICEKGFNQGKQAFVQAYDSDILDASTLLIPILGFLPFNDPRVIATVDAIISELCHDNLLYRYHGDDGLEGREGTFLLCSFWLIDCLIGMDRVNEAEYLLCRLEKVANHLGLFSEEYDVHWKQALGNFPQAFTHIGYVKSVINLLQAKKKRQDRQIKKSANLKVEHLKNSFRKIKPFPQKFLNDGKPDQTIPPDRLIPVLKSRMNMLRGAFFDTLRGRVAYEEMKESNIYRDYVEATFSLKEFDPIILKTRKEKIAFWLNLYNLIIIHGIVESGIKDSVKEVPSFFQRINYIIGEYTYTPDAIEHGILRANRRPPYKLFRIFSKNDPRLSYSIEKEDPRIHFALVCASSSCPPIDLYTSENLDQELTQAAKSFLNGGGLILEKKRMNVHLSRIFKWYGNDFHSNNKELLSVLAEFMYDPETRDFLKKNAGILKIKYQKYDWRLNRESETG